MVGDDSRVLTFPGYAPDRFKRMALTLQSFGLTLEAGEPSGEIEKCGADVIYSYDQTTQQLVLTIKHAPWMHSLSWFDERIKTAVENQE